MGVHFPWGTSLVGPQAAFYYSSVTGVDFSGTDLSGASFQNANLTNVNLSGANLSGADFAAANLTGDDFSGANLTNAGFGYSPSWSNTICPDGTNSDSDGGTCVKNLTPLIPLVLQGVHVGDVLTGAVSLSVSGFGTCTGTLQATVATNPAAPGVATLTETGFSCSGGDNGISLNGNTLTISDSPGFPVTLSGSVFGDGICSSTPSECTLDTETGSWSNSGNIATMTGNIVGPFGGNNPVTAFAIGPVVDTSLPGSPAVVVN